MKKNRMMRVASGLLVAVLLTTCVISGTFAKYVTTGSGTDSARVAKWGVEIEAIGSDVFAETYNDEPNGSQVVTSVTSEKLVAPGTKNSTGVTFSLTGTPEVAVNIKFDITGANNAEEATDVVLPAKTGYKDWTQYPYDGTFDLADDYHPVVFTLKAEGKEDALVTGTIGDIEDYLEGNTVSKDYAANTDLATILGGTTGEYTLTWEWVYGQFDGISETDKADTYLGNVAAEIQDDDAASTDIEFAIAITVTQVD